MLLCWIVTLFLLHTKLAHCADIGVDNGGHQGTWGKLESCPYGTSARGFELLVEPFQGPLDDTVLNGIRLFCARPDETVALAYITSKIGNWGTWSDGQWCPFGKLTSFSLQVEPFWIFDNTAANNIQFLCTDETTLTGDGGPWGSYGNWSQVCHYGICGIKTKVEDPQGKDKDDTALNDVQFRCC